MSICTITAYQREAWATRLYLSHLDHWERYESSEADISDVAHSCVIEHYLDIWPWAW
jgi:hypothetical protein